MEDDIDKLNKLSPHEIYHAAIKKLKTKHKNISWRIKDANEIILTYKSNIFERWATFYEDLYFHTPDSSLINDSNSDKIQPYKK